MTRWPATTRAPLVLAAAFLAVASVGESVARAVASGNNFAYAVALCSVGLITTLPLAWSRPTPAAVTLTLAGVASLLVFRQLTVAGMVAEVIAMYRFGEAGGRAAWPSPAAALLGVPYLVLALSSGEPWGSEAGVLRLLLAVMAPAATLAGMAARARRDAFAETEEREVIAGNLAEHAARGERARVARELHDVVAHHISMVAVQAETARLTTPGMPPAGARRLSAIGDTARSALTEMRRLLGVLREDAELGYVQLRPQPGLMQLNELLDTAREASGSGSRLIMSGSPVALDPGVELAAYRIAQEALTNARRHAPGAAVDVELRYCPDALTVRVRDNGPGGACFAPGLGLTGMRERAAAVGGSFKAGAAGGGGFFVEATLPARAEALA